MKRIVLGVTLGAAALLGGCPIYSSSAGSYRVCDSYACYDCPDPFLSGSCVTWQCGLPSDCDRGFDCTSGQCTPTVSTSPPDASSLACGGSNACPAGAQCKLSGGIAMCVPVVGRTSDASTGTPFDASADTASTRDAPWESAADRSPVGNDSDVGLSFDALTDADSAVSAERADAPDSSSPATPCNSDGECAQGAMKCIDGRCTPLSALCSDGTQCVAPGFACVDGTCEPRCDASSPCPTGYQCDLTSGVCNVDPNPCSGSGTSSCLGGTTCVEGHCVPPCSTSDAASTCPAYQQCVNGGCLPDQAATFSCKNDGQTGQLSNGCGPASICLHHSCYVACTHDAGSAECGDAAGQCKDVRVVSGTYSVCGTPSNLGSACDIAAGARCASPGICIDGYCH
ncbi:MAG: hypothetical protein M3O50_18890 [Myxococcota bacterium]|nr:hypothetical protein [Myxococcota bacterium]